MQRIGLILNLLGTIFFGIGALDRSPTTWGDLKKASNKSICIYKLAWVCLIMNVIGFTIQFLAIG